MIPVWDWRRYAWGVFFGLVASFVLAAILLFTLAELGQ